MAEPVQRFDDAGHWILAVDFDFDTLDGGRDDDGARHRREGVSRILDFIERNRSPIDVGRRVILLRHALGIGERVRQRELARRLGVTQGRVSQMLMRLRREFARFADNSSATSTAG